ncbi:MAG: type II toxin-antitoxin system VapC family toxin [Myxococcota bacterium]
MNLLIDTHLILWAASMPGQLPRAARTLMGDVLNTLSFSAASIWEVAIKAGLEREDFKVDPRILRRGLLDNGWRELVITSKHAAAVGGLPAIHKDPFDRILVAQMQEESMTLVTSDSVLTGYPGAIRCV